MRHRFLTAVLRLFATASTAQEDLLSCLDPDVRHGLLYGFTDTGEPDRARRLDGAAGNQRS